MYEESRGRAAPVLDDRYRLITQLGRGGTARVVRAWDERLGRAVAIKIFQPHADPVGRLRFEDEAKLLAGFDHPGLVKVFDSGSANGAPYLVLELIDGPNLGRRIDQGPMAADEVRQLGVTVADALTYVHSRGVVHRDIKPGNVLLDGSGVPHLADFGLAKLLARSGLTASDRLVGTAAYLSPEQVLGTEVGPPADIYGLGLVLLECLTGEVEYPGLDAETVLARVNRSPHIPPSVPAALADVLSAMTRSDPETRPDAATCAELLRMDSPTVPLRRPSRFTRTRVAFGAVAALVAVAIGWFVFAPVSDFRPSTPDFHTGQSEAGDPTAGSVLPAGVQPTQPTDQRPRTRQAADDRQTITVTSAVPGSDTASVAAPSEPVTTADDKTKKPKKTKETKTNGNGGGNGNGNGGD
jgi:serine/threonine protein kinase